MAQDTSRYTGTAVSVAAGWQCTRVTPPSALFGANGMRIGPDGRLYVAQAFGSQISAIDTFSGAVSVISPQGGPIVAPDDLAFDSKGTLYATEVMSERVCARSPNGEVRIIADGVVGANGSPMAARRGNLPTICRFPTRSSLAPTGTYISRYLATMRFGGFR